MVGGAGYIGCHAAHALRRHGYEAILYDNLSRGHRFLAEGFELIVTDIADHALQALDASNVREIVVVGRRGPAQAAFTNPELRELGELADADVVVDADELERALAVEDPNMDSTSTNNVTILRDYAGRAPTGKSKRVILRFLLSPVELVGDGSGVRTVVLARNQLQEGDGRLKAVATGESESIERISEVAVVAAETPEPLRRSFPREDGRRPNPWIIS